MRLTTITEIFSTSKYPDALKRRNARAREYRKLGWTGKCNAVSFSDLARCTVYRLEATKEGCHHPENET